jgi:hypothetical protein
VTVNPLPVPVITGPSQVCLNTTSEYITEPGMNNYTWTISAGGQITAGGGLGSNSITILWNAVGSRSVNVRYTNTNGCTAASATNYAVTVNALPNPTLSGPNIVCQGAAGNIYTTQSGSGIRNYIWYVNGGTIDAGGTASDPTITITWTDQGARSVGVKYENSYGCSSALPVIYPVTVNPNPEPTITGLASVCVNTTGSVYTTEPGMTEYAWTVLGAIRDPYISGLTTSILSIACQ